MDPAVIAAFLSGVTAVLSSLLALWLTRRKADRDCQQRIDDIKRAIHEGFEMKDDQ